MPEHDPAHPIRAICAAIAVLALIALSASSAVAAGWRRPQTIAYDGVTSPLNDFSGFLSTRDGSRVDIVTLREAKGIVVAPIMPNGRIGKRTQLPASRNAEYPWQDRQAEFAADGQYPNAAVNRSGVVAMAWRTITNSGSFSEQPCVCAIRVDVGIPGHNFSSIVLSDKDRGSKEILGVQVGPTGRVSVLYAVGTGGHDLVLAEIDKPWKAARRRALGLVAHPFGQSPEYARLTEIAGHEEVFVEGSSEIRLTQEPFAALSPTGLTWPQAEGAADDSHIVLSDRQGLIMSVVANGQSDALEVTTPAAAGPFAEPRSVLTPLPSTSSLHTCSLSGAMNDRGEALVAWLCRVTVTQDDLHAALLDSEGHVTALSSVGAPGSYASLRPAVWLDDAGRGIVAVEGSPYRYVLLDGNSFSQWGSLQHGENNSQETIAVATTPSGLGLATWAEESERPQSGVSWAERLELDEAKIGPGRTETGSTRG
jgi:hypothetical protein